MSHYIENAKSAVLPFVALRGIVAFPSIPISMELSEKLDIEACNRANSGDGIIFLVGQKDISVEHPTTKKDFYKVGTVAKIKQFLKLADDNVRIVADGLCRATVVEIPTEDLTADVICKVVRTDKCESVRAEATVREAQKTFEEFLKYLPKFSRELQIQIKSIQAPGLLADNIACSVLVNYVDKQAVLEEYDPLRRLELLTVLMEKELNLLSEEVNIHTQVRKRLEENQKEFYLKEQLKVIKEELGMTDDDDETDEYLEAIEKAKLPKLVEDRLLKEVGKLAKTPYGSAESAVIRNYLDTCLEIPWTKSTKDKTDVNAAKAVLDRDHYGLEKVKDRILEFVAVKQLNPDLKHQIICLVGPPGVGKTSIASSLAKALGRKYVRVSLGGIRDEADIRGHRKTYVASMPGRIVNALMQSGVNNPLILLDEIDKLASDAHGDPASALLEVLDSEQNKSFRDHFVEIPIDLSDCMFICSANTLETVASPLIDRMEIIELPMYNRREKLAIASRHLYPKQLKRHGLTKRNFKLTDDAIYEIIDFYTLEAGVRGLERQIASLCRKAAKKIVSGELKKVEINAGEVEKYLGPRKILPDKIAVENELGIVNGLAYTETGGDLLRVEAVATEGSGKLELTGSLGDIIQESAHIALTYIRSKARVLGIDPEFYKNKDIHIHFPEGAVPKDGPSAGVALACVLASELGGYPVHRDIAMTGEITLHGKVLPIGGLKEKTMAAFKAGVKTILVPEDNRKDIAELDQTVRDNIGFVYCTTIDEVLGRALIMNKITGTESDSVIPLILGTPGETTKENVIYGAKS